MGFLLDTHVLIWWFSDSPRLPAAVRNRLETTEDAVFASPASAFEIATKHRIGKLPEVTALLDDYRNHLASQQFSELPVTAQHALLAGSLPFEHRDPFDRLLIAQTQVEQLVLVSNETLFDRFGVIRFWG